MIKRVMVLLFLALLLAGCVPASSSRPTPVDKGLPGPRSTPARPALIEPVQAALAKQLGIAADQLILEEYRAAQWPDSCLGIRAGEEMCAQTITPGYLLVFSSPSGSYEVHTGGSAKSFRWMALESPPGERTAAVVWQRSGGITGACLRLTVYLDGAYLLEDCIREARMGEGSLPDEAAARLREWQQQYADFRWTSVPPSGSADMIAYELSFNGSGSRTAVESQQAEISAYLEQLAAALRKPGARSGSAVDAESGIEGWVTIGPECPVHPSSKPCPPARFSTSILVLDAQGTYLTSTRSDEEGYFRIALEPGEYILRPEAPSSPPFAKEQRVTVGAASFMTVKIVFDANLNAP